MKNHSKAATTFIMATAVLVLLGIAVMTNASIPLAQSNHGESFYYFKHQITYGLGLGLLAFFIFYRINIALLKKFALPVLIFAIVLLSLVFVPKIGFEALGAKRWINIFGFSFQPSEFAKLALVIYLAHWLESKKDKIKKPTMIFPFLLWTGIIGGLIILEPDFGTFIIICATAFAMYFMAGSDLKTMGLVFLTGIVLLISLVAVEPYRRERFTSFLNPDRDAAGSGYQLKQALIAIGSGEFTGLGLGKGIQKYNYLPETIGDSVFAVVSEELGFIGSTLVLFIYLIWVLSGLKIASLSKDLFSRYLVIGIVAWIGLQAFINALGILGMIPFTGIPLPFISYGGTALMIELASIGMVANIAKNR
ncbi:MAG: putative lipid II flippase FtsW [Patescibacteria group bacterium]